MSIQVTKVYELVCDACFVAVDADGAHPGLQRQFARDDGWRRRRVPGRMLDFCPDCQANGVMEFRMAQGAWAGST